MNPVTDEKLKPKRMFSGVASLPTGSAADIITDGCIALEGGAFRGVYTSGVLDALMENDINLACTVGVSAGALNGLNYVSGQIGRSGRINLSYRLDGRYVGAGNFKSDRGIMGFGFLFGELNDYIPFDRERFDSREMRYIAVCSDCNTGKAAYFDKSDCKDILAAARASASMPYISKPVDVCGTPCLDGGCTDKIPFSFGLNNGYDKVVVVRTRQREYRKTLKPRRAARLAHLFYGKYPEFAAALAVSDEKYNNQCDEIDSLEKQGKIFVIAPSTSLTVGRLEKDMEKLGAFYYLGYNDGKAALPALKEYLSGAAVAAPKIKDNK